MNINDRNSGKTEAYGGTKLINEYQNSTKEAWMNGCRKILIK